MFNWILKYSLFGALCLATLACAAADRPARSPGKPGAPVRVEASGLRSLQPGRAGEIEVTLIPSVDVDNLRIIVRGDAGLTVQAGGSRDYAAPDAGVPLSHRVTLVAANEGRYHVSAVVTTERAGQITGRVVSFSVLVGDAVTAQKAQAKQALPMDSKGERIKSLRATEREPSDR